MKKTCKLFLSCFIILALFTQLGIGSLAATQPKPSEITVMAGDKLLEFNTVKPVMNNNRVFVPLRAFYEQLGAKVAYDDPTQSITCTRYDTTVKLTIGSNTMTITNKSGTTVVKMDVAPYIQGDYTMIPARFAAAGLGCKIGWSEMEQTVLILDPEGMIKASGAHYTLMDKFIKTLKTNNTTYAIDGSCNLSIKDSSSASYQATGSFTGLTNKDALNINLKLDLSSIISAYWVGSDLSASEKLFFSQLKNLDAKLIFSYSDLKAYIQSPVLSSYMGIESDAWISTSISTTGSPIGLVSDTNFEDYIKQSLNSQYLYNRASLTVAVNYLKQYNSIFSDEAFTREDCIYTNSKTFVEGGITTAYKIQFFVMDDKVISYSISANYGDGSQNISFTVDSLNNFSFSYKINSGSSNIEFKLQMKLTETSNTPLTKPASGKIYDMNDIYNNVID